MSGSGSGTASSRGANKTQLKLSAGTDVSLAARRIRERLGKQKPRTEAGLVTSSEALEAFGSSLSSGECCLESPRLA